MAPLLLIMLFIGVAMVSSLGNYHRLVALHRPLGIAILILAIIRLINRKFSTLPPFPPTMSPLERLAASWSERLLYALMIALPLVSATCFGIVAVIRKVGLSGMGPVPGTAVNVTTALIAFSEPAALKTLRVDQLEYVSFQSTPEPRNRVTF